MVANIFCWRGNFVVLQVIRTSIAKKPYIFVIFQVRVRTPCPPPPSGSAHVECIPCGDLEIFALPPISLFHFMARLVITDR